MEDATLVAADTADASVLDSADNCVNEESADDGGSVDTVWVDSDVMTTALAALLEPSKDSLTWPSEDFADALSAPVGD